MTTYIALLRGINVGGHRKILMADLKSLLTKSGLTNVSTYIQSGNIVFESDLDAEALEIQIAKLIKDHYGFDVPTLVRTSEEWGDVVNNNPFLTKNAATPIGQLYVAFLSEEPLDEHVESFRELSFGEDKWILSGRTMFIYYAERFSKSKLTNAPIESKLKVTASSRNWKTVTHLKTMLS